MEQMMLQQTKINDLRQITGCESNQAFAFLRAADWNVEAAVSLFFEVRTAIPTLTERAFTIRGMQVN